MVRDDAETSQEELTGNAIGIYGGAAHSRMTGLQEAGFWPYAAIKGQIRACAVYAAPVRPCDQVHDRARADHVACNAPHPRAAA